MMLIKAFSTSRGFLTVKTKITTKAKTRKEKRVSMTKNLKRQNQVTIALLNSVRSSTGSD